MKDMQYYVTQPKVDAHNHLNLGMHYKTYIAWAGIDIPNFPRPMHGLEEMHEIIAKYTRPRAKTEADVIQLIKMSIEDAIADGVTRLEGSIDIGFMVHFKEDMDRFLRMVTDFVAAYKDTITIAPELGLGKTFDKKKIDKWAPDLLKSGVFTSIDLYGPEIEEGIENFTSLFKLAGKLGLKKRAHVGEFSDAGSVRRFVEFFNLDEVQHGIGAARDDSVLQFLADRKVRCNVCPQSNVLLGAVPSLAEHPIKKMLDAGVPIALGTDDLLFFEDSVSVQLYHLVSQNVITEADADKILQYK
ncbi:MAG TPA: adenosine deaminase [Treponemataceae bacterium]|jgi:adenosine deaminase|nr:adenosine deaminase [Treponemataceae bacterium]HPX47410.1 adenosine deaminase [Treponemataceae bacterium]